jgi:5-methylthioadenosine/S-adenosylhomocysteine deaminase
VQVETLIKARWVVPVEPDDRVLEDHAIAVGGGRITAILPSTEAERQIEAEHEVVCDSHLVMPGLINAHTHSPMTLFRGLADDLPLMTWLNEHIWPAEGRWVHEEFVADGSRLALAEMLRGGITCFNDMYFFPDVTARVAAQVGMRAVVGLIVIDFPSAWADSVDAYFAKGIALHDHLRGHPLVRTAFAAHSPYAVSDDPLTRVRKLADELDLPIHIHVHETADEVRQGLTQHGCRPLARLDRLGLVSPSLAAVHMTQLAADEIDRIAEAGASVVHCPESNLKLASGFCPVARLREAGVNVALGTDGAASNNDLDMLGEMRTAALLAKGVAGDPRALPAAEALRMATLNGARALGLDGEVGSLVPGKAADIVAVDLGRPEATPVYHPVSQLVYAATRDQVTDVWVAGSHLLRDGRLTSIDLGEVVLNARRWGERIGLRDRS